MNKTLLSFGLVCVSALALETSAYAAETAVSAADTAFAKKAAIGGMMEVKMGEVAQKNASSPAVKEFGALMVTDHGKANQELKNLAAKQDIKLPKALPPKKQMMIDDMAKLKGKAFDQAYVSDMVADHRKDVAEFKMEVKNATDPELKAFTEKTLTVIEGHLKKIESIEASMK